MLGTISNPERFKCLIDAIVENKTTSGIKASSIDRLKRMYQSYPEMFNQNVFSAMEMFAKDSATLNSIEISKLSPLFNISLIKNYIMLNDRDQEKAQIRELLQLFAESIGIVLQVSNLRGFKSRFMGALGAEMTFKESFSDSFTRGQATITVPNVRNETQIRLAPDLNHAIISNLMANQDILKNTPIQNFQFQPDQKI